MSLSKSTTFTTLLREAEDETKTISETNFLAYERNTIAHGLEVIREPYLALLALTTPHDQWPFSREITQSIGSAMSRAQIREHIDNLIVLGIVEPHPSTKRRKEYILTEA